MNNSHYLDLIFEQALPVILGMSYNSSQLIDYLSEEKRYFDSTNTSYEIDGDYILFCFDNPEEEQHNFSIDLYKAKEYYKHKLNELYFNENINI